LLRLVAFLFVVGAAVCAAGLLFWPVEVIMVGFFTVREFQILANGLLEWFPPNRPATTFPKFHNLKEVLFICPPMVEFGTALANNAPMIFVERPFSSRGGF